MRNFNLQRRMGDYQVTQRTSDGMFCASELLNQWNATDGNKTKMLKDFLRLEQTNNFIGELEQEMQLVDNHHQGNSPDGIAETHKRRSKTAFCVFVKSLWKSK